MPAASDHGSSLNDASIGGGVCNDTTMQQCATDVNSFADRSGVNMRDTRGMAGTRAAEANSGSGAHPEGKRSGGALTANAALPTLSGDGASNQRSAHRTERGNAHSEIGGGSGGDTTGTGGDLGAVVQAGSSGGGSSSAMMGCGAEAAKMKGKRALQGWPSNPSLPKRLTSGQKLEEVAAAEVGISIKSLDDVVLKLSSDCDESTAALRNAVQTLQTGGQAEIRKLCKPWGVRLGEQKDNGKYCPRAVDDLKRELKNTFIEKAKEHFKAKGQGSTSEPRVREASQANA